MAQLPPTFPFPSRGWMLANMFLFFVFAVLIPLEVGAEFLYRGVTNLYGLALWASAIVNGALAIVWMRYLDRMEKQLNAQLSAL